MSPLPSRRSRSLPSLPLRTSHDNEDDSASSDEADDDSTSESWATAYESTNYDGSDDEAWLAAAMSVMTVEAQPGTLAVVPIDSEPLTQPAPIAPSSPPLALSTSSSSTSSSSPSPSPSPSPSSPLPSSDARQDASLVPAPPAPLAPNLNRANKVYAVDTPKLASPKIVNHWAEAADLTQGVPGASVRSVVVLTNPRQLRPEFPLSATRRPKYKAFSAIKAWQPGVFTSWSDTRLAVFGTPGQLYKGHPTEREAHIHFADMLRKGLVHAEPGYRGQRPLPSPIPTPAGLPPPPESSLTTYVVTQGRRVGVFRDWCEAADQVLFIKRAVVVSYKNPQDAQAAFALAIAQGVVRVRSR